MSQPKQTAVRYSIVIPALDEAQFIGGTLDTLFEYLQQQKWLDSTEVIVVAATGKDNTVEVAAEHGKVFTHFKLLQPGPKVGKGRDVQVGMLAAQGTYRLFMDADLATPIHHLEAAFQALEDDADVVIGSRDLMKVHKTLKRRLVSIVGNRLIYMMLGLRYGDSQCGFKGFSTQATEALFGRQTIMGWGFDIELLTIAREHGLRVMSVPVPDWSDPKGENALVGETAMSAARKTFSELQIIRKLWKQGQYK